MDGVLGIAEAVEGGKRGLRDFSWLLLQPLDSDRGQRPCYRQFLVERSPTTLSCWPIPQKCPSMR